MSWTYNENLPANYTNSETWVDEITADEPELDIDPKTGVERTTIIKYIKQQ